MTVSASANLRNGFRFSHTDTGGSFHHHHHLSHNQSFHTFLNPHYPTSATRPIYSPSCVVQEAQCGKRRLNATTSGYLTVTQVSTRALIPSCTSNTVAALQLPPHTLCSPCCPLQPSSTQPSTMAPHSSPARLPHPSGLAHFVSWGQPQRWTSQQVHLWFQTVKQGFLKGCYHEFAGHTGAMMERMATQQPGEQVESSARLAAIHHRVRLLWAKTCMCTHTHCCFVECVSLSLT